MYTQKEVYKVCNKLGIRMVDDVHHHRCNAVFNLMKDLDVLNNEKKT